MPDAAAPIRRHPLDGMELPATRPGFRLALAAPAVRFVLRGGAEVAARAGGAFAVALPLAPCRANRAGPRSALWLGPDEWLLMAEDAEEPAPLAAHVATAAGNLPHSLVDVSHRQIGLEASGPRAALVLNAGCPLDLGPEAFPPGMAARSILGRIEIVLWRRDAERFRIEAWRSVADYAVRFLAEAARGAPEP